MTRRYGRNQKRRARAQAAEMEKMIISLRDGMVMDRALLEQQRRRIDKQDEQLKLVAKVLGTNFIGLEPALWEFKDKNLPDWLRRPVQGGDVMMHVMKAYITEAKDRPDYMMHFRVKLMDEVVGYAISECALRDGPDEYIVHRIGEEMATLLVAELRKKFSVERR